MILKMYIRTVILTALLCAGCTSGPNADRESSRAAAAPKPRSETVPLSMRQLQSNRDAMAITRRMKGLPPADLRLRPVSKSLQRAGVAPGIIIPGVDDLGEK